MKAEHWENLKIAKLVFDIVSSLGCLVLFVYWMGTSLWQQAHDNSDWKMSFVIGGVWLLLSNTLSGRDK